MKGSLYIFLLRFQRVGVQPGGIAVRVGHQVGRPRPGRHLGGVDQTAEILQENFGQERGEHQDHEDTQGTGIPAVRVQQQQFAVAVQMIVVAGIYDNLLLNPIVRLSYNYRTFLTSGPIFRDTILKKKKKNH